MKVKRLKKNEMRVICIDESAIVELIEESIIDRAEEYFDILDAKKVSFHMVYCSEHNRFVCAIVDENDSREFDLSKVINSLPITTPSLFVKNRFVTIDATKCI